MKIQPAYIQELYCIVLLNALQHPAFQNQPRICRSATSRQYYFWLIPRLIPYIQIIYCISNGHSFALCHLQIQSFFWYIEICSFMLLLKPSIPKLLQITEHTPIFHVNLHSFRFAQAQIDNEIASFVPSFTLFLCYTLLMQVHYRARRRK